MQCYLYIHIQHVVLLTYLYIYIFCAFEGKTSTPDRQRQTAIGTLIIVKSYLVYKIIWSIPIPEEHYNAGRQAR